MSIYEGQDERRDNYPRPESELYDLNNVEQEISKERRLDELDRLREVSVQKRTWKRTMLFCLSLNLLLIILALIGMNNS